MKKILVTGAVGFIGSAFCRYVLQNNLAEIVGVDKMTYAASPRTLEDLQKFPGFQFCKLDITDAAIVNVMETTAPDAVIHFAAETHVDRSIDSSGAFIHTNLIGTYVLLEASRVYLASLPPEKQERFRFHNVSTDEVYGSLGKDGAFSETTPYAPNSPYSASKAGADHLVRAWYQTYGLPTIISNCSNNYGPYQFPEKLIPNMITKALRGEKLPVYGKGDNVRDWLYVDDHAEALWLVLTRGRLGEKYMIGGDGEKTNLDLVKQLCTLLDEKLPDAAHRPHEGLIEFVTDRPGHDKRYATDITKMNNELGWKPKIMLPEGLAKTVDWYLGNRIWWEDIHGRQYAGERLGQTAAATSAS
ncbi:MAG: dTDP-glucose 4,6-dehydratase [Alphaproteobacteria bacterium]|nr:dTDP-glucose 4,6-dehydratase [Alphaproteobacteria bacterium]